VLEGLGTTIQLAPLAQDSAHRYVLMNVASCLAPWVMYVG